MSQETIALLVHKQASFTRQNSRPRSTTFASTVAVGCSSLLWNQALVPATEYDLLVFMQNRFYEDNSLARQRRLIECTKRRQARAREKAIEQEYYVDQMKSELEESIRLRKLKEEREAYRMMRKLRDVAATYIQYVWRKHAFHNAQIVRRENAAQSIAGFTLSYMRIRKTVRHQASIHIQSRWRRFLQAQKVYRYVEILRKFCSAVRCARQAKSFVFTKRIQRWYRNIRARCRLKAVLSVQRAWRLRRAKERLSHCSKAYRHLKHLKRLEHCARILQRTLGRYAVYKQLLREHGLSNYVVVSQQFKMVAQDGLVPDHVLRNQQRELQEAVSTGKRLLSQETSLRQDIDDLCLHVKQANERLAQESTRLQRMGELEAYRRKQDDARQQQELLTLANSKRFEIRLELEKELDLKRREALLRSKKQPLGLSAAVSRSQEEQDARVELT